MSDIIAVKKAIINLLKADSTLQSLLEKDSNGNWPIYHTFVQHSIHKPCITVEDITDQGEVSGLNDSYDGAKRYGWHLAIIQIDCWSTKHADERDQLQVAVQECFLKGSNQNALRSSGVVYIQDPSILALDEPNVKPLLWRKSLRYSVFYILEAS